MRVGSEGCISASDGKSSSRYVSCLQPNLHRHWETTLYKWSQRLCLRLRRYINIFIIIMCTSWSSSTRSSLLVKLFFNFCKTHLLPGSSIKTITSGRTYISNADEGSPGIPGIPSITSLRANNLALVARLFCNNKDIFWRLVIHLVLSLNE